MRGIEVSFLKGGILWLAWPVTSSLDSRGNSCSVSWFGLRWWSALRFMNMSSAPFGCMFRNWEKVLRFGKTTRAVRRAQVTSVWTASRDHGQDERSEDDGPFNVRPSFDGLREEASKYYLPMTGDKNALVDVIMTHLDRHNPISWSHKSIFHLKGLTL